MRKIKTGGILLLAALSSIGVALATGVADSQSPNRPAQQPLVPGRPDCGLTGRSEHAQPELPTVAGETRSGCPGARRVLPPGAVTSQDAQVVVTRGRDGKSWTIPYTVERVYEQLADGTLTETVVGFEESLRASQEAIIAPEDLAELRGGPKAKD